MTRLALALTVVVSGFTAGLLTDRPAMHGTVLVPLASREPELRASRGFRRPPLASRTRTVREHRPRDGGWQRWLNVARCESSGHWHDNTGNGYYGGLQEDLTFWRRYGGLAFARRPDLASEAQQIVVAERGLTVQGRGAWPVCGRFL